MRPELKFLYGEGYSKLGHREKRILMVADVLPDGAGYVNVRHTSYGALEISTPGGSFEVAWDIPGYDRGVVVG